MDGGRTTRAHRVHRNVGAIRLYEQLGFEHEGTIRPYGFARGRLVDAHIMARLTAAPRTS